MKREKKRKEALETNEMKAPDAAQRRGPCQHVSCCVVREVLKRALLREAGRFFWRLIVSGGEAIGRLSGREISGAGSARGVPARGWRAG